MREIKFRAWQNGHKRMREVTNIRFKDGVISEVAIKQPNTAPAFQTYGIGEYPLEYLNLMQYTGLKDKNGKEIYEGDVLYSIDNIVVESIGGYGRTEQEAAFAVVTYDTDLAAFVLQSDNVMLKDELIWEHACYSEIIGNIYENPELIKT